MNWLRIVIFSILDTQDEESTDFIIAKYILDNYKDLAGTSLSEISRNCNVSKASISRFCKKLGLLDYIDLQSLIRTSQNSKSYVENKSTYVENKSTIDEQKSTYLELLNNYTIDFPKIIQNGIVEELINDICKYNSISILGHLQASHIAYTLRNNLAMFSKLSFCSQSISEQKKRISNATKKDLIIIFSSSGDFFRRIDINTNFLKRENSPKVYMISFGKEENNNNLFINRIFLNEKYVDLFSNILMNIFINYISYRVASTVSFYET